MAIGNKNGAGISRAMELAEFVAGDLERQTDLIYRLLEQNVDANRRAVTRRYICQTETVAADGTCQFKLQVPAGQGWTLITMAGAVTGTIPSGAGVYGAIYLGEVANQNAIRGFPVGTVYSDDFQANEYVPEHTFIIAKLFGLTAGEKADFNLRYIMEDE